VVQKLYKKQPNIIKEMRLLSAAFVMLLRTAVTALVVVTLSTSSALAFDPTDLKKLMETKECVECDLEGADLVRANLKGANLEGVNLKKAILIKVDLRSANLAGSDLEGANLWTAYLWKGNLEGVNLKGANLLNADIRFVRMKNTILCNTTMPDGSIIDRDC
jgi:uncharacterized protein YjbI with pentapeptide repeats